jgi:hypothetical protein
MKKPVIDQRLRKPNSDRDLRKISVHAKKRFKERFGHPLTDEELLEIESQINSGLGKLVNWTHGHPGVYLVSWKEFEFHAVFEYRTAKIITFLTKDMSFLESTEE